MALKHKPTPSQNPFHSGASTSDSTPSHVLFHDEKARKDFLENFSGRGIHSEGQVVLSDFSVTLWHLGHLSLRDHIAVLL